jgi:uncharacterized protein
VSASPNQLKRPPLGPRVPAAGMRPSAIRLVWVVALVSALCVAAALIIIMRPGSKGAPFAVTPIEMRPDAPAGLAGTAPERQNGSSSPEQTPGVVKLASAPDPRLIEQTRYGLLPRIGADGARPDQVYARPAAAAAGPRVAILVTGLGISQSGGADAIAQLPPEISLAFGPYGSDLERSVQQAREAGHEVMLQVPMEPFDYPDNDPGPHTLRARAPLQENMQRLHWVMGRFTGYTGLVNTTGARFAVDESSLSPITAEIAGRGLIFLDGSSTARPKSVSGDARPSGHLVVDVVPRADAIDRELERLEALARAGGVAVGVASPAPIALERILRWAKTLKEKRLHLVPVSAAFEKPSQP